MPIKRWDHESLHETVSWSKIGFICYATPESTTHNLKMTYLENTDGVSWQLARPHTLRVKPSENGPLPYIHMVKWSNLSTDLAVFDHLGNFYVLLAGVGMLRKKETAKNDKKEPNGKKKELNGKESNGKESNGKESNGESGDDGPSYELTSYNHTEMIYRDVLVREDQEFSHGGAKACVAFKWLGIAKPSIVNKPAKLDDDGTNYSYGVQSQQAPSVAHPIPTKQACAALRVDGSLTLYYQGEHKVEYHKLTVPIQEGAVHLTHASIGYLASNSLLVTAFDVVSKKIMSFSVLIAWGFLDESAIKQRADPHYHTPLGAQTPPSLTVQLLHEMAPEPSILYEDQIEPGAPQNPQEAISTRLVSIDMVTLPHESSPRVNTLLSYESIAADGSTSYTMHRYEIKDVVGHLRAPFSNNSWSGEGSSGPFYVLQFQDRMTVSKTLKAVRKLLGDGVLLLVHTDGTFMAVNIETWTIINTKKIKADGVKLETEGMDGDVKMETDNTDMETDSKNPEVVSSLLDCGFTFPRLNVNESHPFVFCVSPNMTAVVYKALGDDTPLQLALLERPNPSENTKLASVGFSCIHAHACYTNNCSDDLLALIRAQYSQIADDGIRKKLLKDTVTSSHAALNFRVNSFAKESVDKLLSNPPLQKLLSLQLVLSEVSKNDVSSQVAWVVLNLRSTSFGIMFTLSSIYRQVSKKKPIEDTLQESISRAECITSLVGNIQWIIDLMIYFNQELFQLSLSRTSPGTSPVTIDNCIVLPIILSKVPRFFLMYALSSIGKTCEILKKLFKDLGESNKLFSPMKESLNRFFNVCKSSPMEISAFEGFLRECETFITKEMTAVTSDRMKMLKLEQQIFCHGEIPQECRGIAQSIVDRHSSTFNRETKLSEIYFYDSSWLNVGPLFGHQPHLPPAPDMTIVRLNFNNRESVDALRKVLFECPPFLKSGGSSPMGQAFSSKDKIRKCVRCRSVSSVADPLVYESTHPVGLWTMVFQRTCICGSVWVNCI